MKKILYYLYEKNVAIKIVVAILLAIILGLTWRFTGEQYSFLLKSIWVPGIYLIIFLLISFAYAWVINPIRDLKKKRKEKKRKVKCGGLV